MVHHASCKSNTSLSCSLTISKSLRKLQPLTKPKKKKKKKKLETSNGPFLAWIVRGVCRSLFFFLQPASCSKTSQLNIKTPMALPQLRHRHSGQFLFLFRSGTVSVLCSTALGLVVGFAFRGSLVRIPRADVISFIRGSFRFLDSFSCCLCSLLN